MGKARPRRRQVFLSYAHADKNTARRLAAALREAGVGVSLDEWEIQPGDTISERVRKLISANDLLVILLSRHSVRSTWVAELTSSLRRELNDRAVTLVPALIENCEIPSALAEYAFLDLRTF